MRRVHYAAMSILLAAGLVLVLSPGAAAQVAGLGPSDPVLDRMHDEIFESLAISSHEFPAKLQEAATKHGHVADLRESDDARTFSCLRSQAALLAGIGDLAGAREYMVKAADHARARGFVVEAAMAYIDAAILAKHAKDFEAANELANRALGLSAFYQLDDELRASIVARIDGQK